MSENKLFKGMLIGAIVGGALTLFDKDTRVAVKKQSKEIYFTVAEKVRNPKQTFQQFQTKIDHFRQSIEEISEDVRFMAEKAGEIKEIGVATKATLEETKEAFMKEK